MYVVRLSCELPYAVGVRKNTAESITLRQRKQSKKAAPGVLFERPVPQYSVLTRLVLCFSPRLPQVGLEPTPLQVSSRIEVARDEYAQAAERSRQAKL